MVDAYAVFTGRRRDEHGYDRDFLKKLQKEDPEAFKFLADFEAVHTYGYKGGHNKNKEDNVVWEQMEPHLREIWRNDYKRRHDVFTGNMCEVNQFADYRKPSIRERYENIEEEIRIHNIDEARKAKKGK